jgi:hypothetical protein
LNFFYARYKIIEKFGLWLKPSEGLLTKEGWEKTEARIAEEEVGENKSNSDDQCPFKGRVFAEVEAGALGFKWTKADTAFIITDDWHVLDKDGRELGWIDVKGSIHEGLGSFSGKIDPNATLGAGYTGIRISGSGCYKENEKIGEFVRW